MTQIDIGKKISIEKVASKIFIYQPAFLCFYPELTVMSSGSEYFDLNEIPKEQIEEIHDFCRSCNSRVMVCGNEDVIYLICPTLYPSSSICLALRMTLPPRQILKLIEVCAPDSFVISKHLKLTPARMSDRIQKLKDGFSAFLTELESCFLNIGVAEDISMLQLCRLCCDIALFVGCPIEIDVDSVDEQMSNVDRPMVAAFVANILDLARGYGDDRSARIKISVLYGAPFIQISFVYGGSMTAVNDYYRWRNITNERDMHLYLYEKDGVITLSLHFYRIDPAMLGLKSPLLLRQRLTKWMT